MQMHFPRQIIQSFVAYLVCQPPGRISSLFCDALWRSVHQAKQSLVHRCGNCIAQHSFRPLPSLTFTLLHSWDDLLMDSCFLVSQAMSECLRTRQQLCR